MHFIDEENIVTVVDFDCGINFTLKLPQKSNSSTENGKTFPLLVNNPSASQVTISVTVLLIRSIPLMFFWARTIYVTWIQQLLSHSTNVTMENLCPISTFKQQFTNLQQTYIRWSLHCERWTVKRKDCSSVLHSFRKITYRRDDWGKQLLLLKNWVIPGSLEQWMEVHHLWWHVVVFKCSSLVWLFDFYCLLVR